MEANEVSCGGCSVNIEGERWQCRNKIYILALPLISSSSSLTAGLKTCKFLEFQVSSAPWPYALHMDGWREVVVLGKAKVCMLILSLIVPQYGACPCHLMKSVGEKGCLAALGCDCSATHYKPYSYKARTGDPVKIWCICHRKQLEENRARESTMFLDSENHRIIKVGKDWIITYITAHIISAQNRYLCLDLKYIYP